MPEILFLIFIIVSLFFFFLISCRSSLKECNSKLQNWAKKHGYSIIKSEAGIWNYTGANCEFYITVKTENKEIKTGRIIFGGIFIGIQWQPDKVEVIWDDEKLKS